MREESKQESMDADLGGNKFVFIGGGVSITYYPARPGPIAPGREGPEFTYQGPEGTISFHGSEVDVASGPLGTLLTVVLQPNAGAGDRNISVVVPKALGVGEGTPVTFSTLAIRTAGRGNVTTPGAALTYEVLPLAGEAYHVMMPL